MRTPALLRFALSLVLLFAATVAMAADKPNVIVIVADDLGTADLGCYGCKDIQTPNIDALARSGARFTQMYSAAPVCSPARAALMTGRSPQRAGVPGNVSSKPDAVGLPAQEMTLAELLKPLGYRTALFGKWHLGGRPETSPNGQGFDEFFGFKTGCIEYYRHIHTYGNWRGHDLWRNSQEVREDGRSITDLIGREAVRFLGENKDQPFLMVLTYSAPHYPMQGPDEWFNKYKNLPGDRQAYAALLSAMDVSIGSVLAKVKDLGLREKTAVFFLSDNGPSTERRAGGGGGSNAPFRSSKGSLFDGGLRVPLIATWPGHWPENQTRSQLAVTMDLFPTIADLCAATPPSGLVLDGKNLASVLRDNSSIDRGPLCWEFAKGQAVRSGPWKLVVGPTGGLDSPIDLDAGAVWLSNVEQDPGETTNVAAANAEVVDRLRREWTQWRKTLAKP